MSGYIVESYAQLLVYRVIHNDFEASVFIYAVTVESREIAQIKA